MPLDALRAAALSVRRGDTPSSNVPQADPRADAQAAHAGLTFSAGVDIFQRGDTLASLMARADTALYEAKTRGRDRVVCATTS